MKELLLFVLLVAVAALFWDDKNQRDSLNQAQQQVQDVTRQRDELATQFSNGANPQFAHGSAPAWFQDRLQHAGSLDLAAPKNH